MHVHVTTTIMLHLSEGITCLHNHCINLMQLVCTTFHNHCPLAGRNLGNYSVVKTTTLFLQ